MFKKWRIKFQIRIHQNNKDYDKIYCATELKEESKKQPSYILSVTINTQ